VVKLLEVIKKNFKILIRSKSSALIILFGPLLLILLVGTAFNTSTFSAIKVGSYSGSYNELSNSILDKLSQEDYLIFKTNSPESCIQGVKTGAYHLCTIIPDDLQVSDDANNTIDIHVDSSRLNLVYAVKGAIINSLGERTKELSQDLTSIVVNQLETAKSALQEKQGVLTSLKNTNEQFTSGIVTMEQSVGQLGDSDIVTGELKNKTAALKAQTNETRAFTELEDLISVLETQLSAVKSITDVIPGLKEISIAESSQLVDLERTSGKLITSIEAIKVRDVETLVSPIKTSTQSVTTERTHINYLFPTLIMMVVMFVSLLLSSITVIREKISPAYFRNCISPNKPLLFIVATYLTNILIIIFQLVIVFAVMAAIQPEILNTLLQVSGAVLIITSAFILLGMIIGYLFNSEETSTIGAISLGTILLFFSNTIIPLETLPASIQNLVEYNMFVVSDSLLRSMIIFESSLSNNVQDLYILLGHIVVFIIGIAVIYKFSSKRFNIKRYFHK